MHENHSKTEAFTQQKPSFAEVCAARAATVSAAVVLPFPISEPVEAVYQTSYTLVQSEGLLTKSLTVSPGGKVEKSSTVGLSRGTVRRMSVSGTVSQILADFGRTLEALKSNQAIITAPPPGDEDELRLLTKADLPYHQGAIARTRETFFPLRTPAIFGLDFDTGDFTPPLMLRIRQVGDISKVLASIHPAFSSAARLVRLSVSSRAALKGGRPSNKGHHRYFVVPDAIAAEGYMEIVADRLMLAGFVWPRITASGLVDPRTLIDITASTDQSRLWYEADPVFVDDRIAFDESAKIADLTPGGLLDLQGIQPLTDEERARLEEVKDELRKSVEPEASAARAAWQQRQIDKLTAKGVDVERAKRTVLGALQKHELSGDFEIVIDDGSVATIREILADRRGFHGMTCGDPLEPEYGAGKAKIFSDQPAPYIHSFAHGETNYRLTPMPEDFFDVLPIEAPAAEGGGSLEPQDIFGHESRLQLAEPPANCLPKTLERWARSEARRKGVSMAFACASALAAVGSSIGASLKIQVREHDDNFHEPASLWVVLVADPGSAKSAIINAALKPLRELDAEWKRADLPKQADWARRAKQLARKNELPPGPEPKIRRLIVDDVTSEMQVRIHAANPRGIARSTDELAGMLETLGAYKRTGGGDRNFMLRLFDGDAITVDRVSSGSTFAEHALMAVLAGTQPDKLKTMVRDMQTDGLLQRFLFVLDSGQRGGAIDEQPDRLAAAGYRDLLRHFASVEYVRPKMLQVSPSARPLVRGFLDRIRSLEHMPGSSSAWRGHISKIEKIAARVVLCFHAIESYEVLEEVRPDIEIASETVQRALAFTSFLLRHSLKFYESFFDADPAYAEAVGLAGYLLTRPELKTINRRDIYQARSSLKGAENRHALLAAARSLEEAGWLQVYKRETDGPASWTVNVAVHARFEARAEQERVERAEKHESIKRAAEARRMLQELEE